MKTVTKFQTDDGCEFNTIADAMNHEDKCREIAAIMAPLGTVKIKDSNCYYQHDPATVIRCRVAILKMAARYIDDPVFRHEPPEEVHPFSIAGRILDDVGGPLRDPWFRFMRIDDLGREWEQPYFVSRPPEDAVCINPDRSWSGES